MPKSVSRTRPSAVTRMLPGLTSRWTKPAWWAASSAGRDARADVDRQLGAEPGLHVEQLAQALAVDELHDDGLAALVLEDVVDGDDVGVGQAGDGDGLAAEALGDDGVGGEARLEPLQGDLAVERDVGGEPHLGHAALGQPPLEPVAVGEHDRVGTARRARARGRWGGRRRHSGPERYLRSPLHLREGREVSTLTSGLTLRVAARRRRPARRARRCRRRLGSVGRQPPRRVRRPRGCRPRRAWPGGPAGADGSGRTTTTRAQTAPPVTTCPRPDSALTRAVMTTGPCMTRPPVGVTISMPIAEVPFDCASTGISHLGVRRRRRARPRRRPRGSAAWASSAARSPQVLGARVADAQPQRRAASGERERERAGELHRGVQVADLGVDAGQLGDGVVVGDGGRQQRVEGGVPGGALRARRPASTPPRSPSPRAVSPRRRAGEVGTGGRRQAHDLGSRPGTSMDVRRRREARPARTARSRASRRGSRRAWRPPRGRARPRWAARAHAARAATGRAAGARRARPSAARRRRSA